jgi:stage III sporulation protein AA
MMMLRSMSPDVLVVDEIGHAEDAAALREAAHAGVGVVATAHARDLQDARGRPILRELIEEGTFAAFVELRRTPEGFRSRVLRPGPSPLAREPTPRGAERPSC